MNSNSIWKDSISKNILRKKHKQIPAHPRKKPNRNGQDKIILPSDFPVETTVLDLPEEQKVCPETGKPLVKIGEETTHKLVQEPGRYYIKKIIRPKYINPKNLKPEFLLPICQTASFQNAVLTRAFWLRSQQGSSPIICPCIGSQKS